MKRSRQSPVLWLLNKDYCESFNIYIPRKQDFHGLILPKLPPNWKIIEKDIWFHCSSSENVTPRQGWKIHVSATPGNAREVLTRVAEVLFDCGGTNFKFAMDMSVLFLLNSKNWSRGSSGKFITIYPQDNHSFVDLIEQIHRATTGFVGPYILSDYRYSDSNIVFFRYGGMRVDQGVNIKGERYSTLVCPDGREIPDERHAYPVTLSWVSEALPVEMTTPSEEPQTVYKGRYKIETAIAFSNAGGIYRGIEVMTGRKVVIKEARPLVNATLDGYDAVDQLKKEYCLLKVIAGARIAPEPIDLFQEWEHWFLVEEYIEGMPLGVHSSQHNILLRTRPTLSDWTEWFSLFCSICDKLIAIVRHLHSLDIVFNDLSPNNLIVEAGTGELKIIDFEGAYRIGVDRASSIYTPGFISQGRLAGARGAFEDDYYSVGAVLLAYLFPVNSFLHLKPQAKEEIMRNIQRDTSLPEPIVQMVLTLTHQDAARRHLPQNIAEVLGSCEPVKCESRMERPSFDYKAIVDGIVIHINNNASYHRRDRLFPADAKIFATNPVSLAYGAAGVGYALQKVTNSFQPEIADWILRHNITPETYAPGLYLGLAGVAWGVLEMGARCEAEQIFHSSIGHRLLDQSADIFYGIAGWGLSSLRFFLETQDEFYLDQAKHAGSKLLATSKKCERGCYWEGSGETLLGFAHGASGIALFLLYLYLATENERFLIAGQNALEFDLSFGTRTKDGGRSWRRSVDGEGTVYPYWRFGSAGIGTTVVRFFRLLGTDHYRSILEEIFIDTDRKYAVLTGHFMGLAGLGGFLLDMYELTKESRFVEAAQQIAEGVLQFQVERGGYAFPGDPLSRLSCDYGTGSCGIALFLHRLSGVHNGDFLLDSLFENIRVMK